MFSWQISLASPVESSVMITRDAVGCEEHTTNAPGAYGVTSSVNMNTAPSWRMAIRGNFPRSGLIMG
jgi:hypothetical protein